MKVILAAMVITLTGLAASANGGRNASMICMNNGKEISSQGYFHYVFPTKVMQRGSKIEILDYANDYKKIQTTVTSLENYKVILEDAASGFKLVIDQDQAIKPGPQFGDAGWVAYVTHKNQKDYKISCVLSGSPQLE